jgi:hypothetical protein
MWQNQTTGNNGEVWEAAVARFLWDVQNSSSSTTVTASTLATVIKNCRLTADLQYPIHAVSDLIWCLNGYDASLRSTYFPNGLQYSSVSSPVSLSSAAKAAVQTLWLRDLKRQ